MGILWRKSFGVTPISDIQSDIIYGVRVKRTTDDDQTWISILGVYLPCLDMEVELYRDSLVDLERVVLESQQWGPVIVAGDFNAHLGPMCGPRAHMSPNVQGVLLSEVLDRCKLHAVSMSRPLPVLNPVEVLERSDLNTSEYLSLSVSLSCDIPTQFANDPNWIRIYWAKAEKLGTMVNFQKEVSDRLKPFTQRSRGNVDYIDRGWACGMADYSCSPQDATSAEGK